MAAFFRRLRANSPRAERARRAFTCVAGLLRAALSASGLTVIACRRHCCFLHATGRRHDGDSICPCPKVLAQRPARVLRANEQEYIP